jgi:hypothetical protein
MMTKNRFRTAALLAGPICFFSGCSEPDGRLARFAEQATAQQAAQNRDMSRANQQLTEATQRLIEREAAASQELLAHQQQLRQDQAEVGQQRDLLEQERKQAAASRLTESKWGAIFSAAALVLAALSPLVLAAIALLASWRPSADPTYGDGLLEYLTAHPSCLTESAQRRLPTPPESASVPRIEQTGAEDRNPASD